MMFIHGVCCFCYIWINVFLCYSLHVFIMTNM
jgi:hypothetical protein